MCRCLSCKSAPVWLEEILLTRLIFKYMYNTELHILKIGLHHDSNLSYRYIFLCLFNLKHICPSGTLGWSSNYTLSTHVSFQNSVRYFSKERVTGLKSSMSYHQWRLSQDLFFLLFSLVKTSSLHNMHCWRDFIYSQLCSEKYIN